MILDAIILFFVDVLSKLLKILPASVSITFSSYFLKFIQYGMYFVGSDFFVGIFSALVTELSAFFVFWSVEYILSFIRGGGR